jgi:hypothetical protein
MEHTPTPPEPPEAEQPVAATASAPKRHSAAPQKKAGTRTGRPGESAQPRVGREIGGKKFRVGAGDEYVPFRSRTRRRRKLTAAGLFGTAVLGAGAYGVVTLVGSDSQASTAAACPAKPGTNENPVALAQAGAVAPAQAIAQPGTGQASTAQPNLSQIKLNVYNSTNRQGLAAMTADTLKKRGFIIVKVTNDPLKANLAASAEVRGASPAAMRVVAAQVVGSRLQPDARTDGTVDLVLGAGFTTLASPDQVSATLASPTSSTPRAGHGCH